MSVHQVLRSSHMSTKHKLNHAGRGRVCDVCRSGCREARVDDEMQSFYKQRAVMRVAVVKATGACINEVVKLGCDGACN